MKKTTILHKRANSNDVLLETVDDNEEDDSGYIEEVTVTESVLDMRGSLSPLRLPSRHSGSGSGSGGSSAPGSQDREREGGKDLAGPQIFPLPTRQAPVPPPSASRHQQHSLSQPARHSSTLMIDNNQNTFENSWNTSAVVGGAPGAVQKVVVKHSQQQQHSGTLTVIPDTEPSHTQALQPGSYGKHTARVTHPYAHLFDLIDRNGDGRLTLTEFIVALRKQPSVAQVERLVSFTMISDRLL
jgi:hypothetical protein